MKELACPTLLLTPTDELKFAKLGGRPNLPANLDWPIGYERPCTFVAQIDLAVVAPLSGIDWLPLEGKLFAFWDPDGADAPDAVRILWSQQAGDAEVTAPAGAKPALPERRVGFVKFTSAPSLDWLGIHVSELDVDEREVREFEDSSDAPSPDEIQHRLGGYPNEIQPGQMALFCEYAARGLPDPTWDAEVPSAIDRASKTWRLLLQIDSDPALKLNFGDGGRLYVFIRESDARAADFSKAVTIWQTY